MPLYLLPSLQLLMAEEDEEEEHEEQGGGGGGVPSAVDLTGCSCLPNVTNPSMWLMAPQSGI